MRVHFLYRNHLLGGIRIQRHGCCETAVQGGVVVHFVLQRAAANQLGVFNRLAASGGVDDVGVFAILDTVLNVRTTFMHLVHQARVDARFAQHNRRTVGRIQLEALLQQLRRQVDHTLFVAFANGEQRTPLFFHW